MGKKRKNIPLPQLPEGITIIDTHCHLDMIGKGDEIGLTINKALTNGVSHIVSVGIDLESSRAAIELASRYESVYATVGIHPHNVGSLEDNTYKALEKLCRHPKVVAFGEIGLDYVKEYAPLDKQLEHFEKQVELAKKVELPVVIHDREAHNDILNILKKHAPFPSGGVMHCFSGDWSYGVKVLDLDFLISIPGVVTFNKATELQEVARNVPLDRLILETDAPFLAPDPLRGRRNIPDYVLYTAQKIADLRQISLAELVSSTTDNALKIFAIPTRS